MLEYIAVEPRKSVKRTTCEPTVTSSSGEMTSRANRSRNSCQFVTRAAVRMSSSQLLSCSESCTGNLFGLETKTFLRSSLEGKTFNSNRSSAQTISASNSVSALSIDQNVVGSLTCGDCKR